ncbi:N-lysine methyltransferase SMYD2-B-like isoform X2 [Paramacrobiotus metropolitanus]|uniref:N-lysine methyltransferase SMYD2-B-like isoform X2 n=1 Tax=Paramacrobiotus metropolitanus TaxID=2943436 RepID=UPI002445688B|nr:N-lysine methyltransferase SMYD2-B-like isoform X2 [Paramacrobiotus metropolitanus]
MLIEHLTVQQHPLPVASNEMASGTAAESVQSEPVVALPATRSLIKTGDLILACDPWVWCLQWERYDTTCAYCGSEPQKLFKCAGCKLHRYCGEKCQVADWKTEHKRECCALKVVAHQIREVLRSHTCDSCHKLILTDGPLISGSASAILMAKIMTKVKLNGVDELPGLEGKSPLEIFESFPKHPKLAVLSDVFREMCPAFIQLVAQFVPPLFPNVYECLGMLHNNNFHIHGQGPREFLFGNALFPHVPLQNMKAVCWNSNVIPYFRGRRLYLWATADLPDYTGLQDLTYTDQMIRYFQYTAAQRREVFARTNGNRTCNCGGGYKSVKMYHSRMFWADSC